MKRWALFVFMLSIFASQAAIAQNYKVEYSIGEGDPQDGSFNPMAGAVTWATTHNNSRIWLVTRATLDLALLQFDNQTNSIQLVDTDSYFLAPYQAFNQLVPGPSDEQLYAISSGRLSVLQYDETLKAVSEFQQIDFSGTYIHFSPDGKYAYAMESSEVIVAFARNQQTGALTKLNSIDTPSSFGCESMAVNPMTGSIFVECITSKDFSGYPYTDIFWLETDDVTGYLTEFRNTNLGHQLDIKRTLSATPRGVIIRHKRGFALIVEDGSTLRYVDSGLSNVNVVSISASSDGQVLYALESQTGKVFSLKFNPDNPVGLESIEENSQGTWSSTSLRTDSSGSSVLAFRPAERQIDIYNKTADSGTLQLVTSFQGSTGYPIWGMSDISGMTQSADRKSLYVVSPGNSLVHFNRSVPSDRWKYVQTQTMLFPQGGNLQQLIHSSDGRFVYGMIGASDKSLNKIVIYERDLVYGLLTEKMVLTQADFKFEVDHAAMTPDGRHIILGGTDFSVLTILNRDPLTGELGLSENLSGNSVINLVISPDGSNLYTVGSSRIRTFTVDPETAHLVEIQYEPTSSSTLRITRDGRHLYSGASTYLDIWERTDDYGKVVQLQRLEEVPGRSEVRMRPKSIALTPNGEWFLASIRLIGGTQTVWFKRDSATGSITYNGYMDAMTGHSMLFDENNPEIISFLNDRIYVWSPFEAVVIDIEDIEDDESIPTESLTLSIYPNPSWGEVFVKRNELETTVYISIFDVAGKKVGKLSQPMPEQQLRIDLRHLSPGTYLLRACNSKAECVAKPFVLLN